MQRKLQAALGRVTEILVHYFGAGLSPNLKTCALAATVVRILIPRLQTQTEPRAPQESDFDGLPLGLVIEAFERRRKASASRRRRRRRQAARLYGP
jgi:hypothetical protein